MKLLYKVKSRRIETPYNVNYICQWELETRKILWAHRGVSHLNWCKIGRVPDLLEGLIRVKFTYRFFYVHAVWSTQERSLNNCYGFDAEYHCFYDCGYKNTPKIQHQYSEMLIFVPVSGQWLGNLSGFQSILFDILSNACMHIPGIVHLPICSSILR